MSKACLCVLLLIATLVAQAGEYEEAIKLLRAGKYSVAQTLLEVAQKKEDSPKVRYALGYCAEKQGQTKVACENYFKVIAINIDTYAHRQETELALKRLEKLVPEVFPILNKAWELQTEAEQASGVARAYQLDAARHIFLYALDSQNLVDARKKAASESPGPKPSFASLFDRTAAKRQAHGDLWKRPEGKYMVYYGNNAWKAYYEIDTDGEVTLLETQHKGVTRKFSTKLPAKREHMRLMFANHSATGIVQTFPEWRTEFLSGGKVSVVTPQGISDDHNWQKHPRVE